MISCMIQAKEIFIAYSSVVKLSVMWDILGKIFE